MKLFRGNKFGVFTGANGYYMAAMANDGVSHYQPQNGGHGWTESTLRKCNSEAQSAENSQDDEEE